MDKYGLIGYPLGHSFSVTYFNEKFQSENIDAEYVNFEIPSIEDFPEVVDENLNLCGLNVTIPYKEQVIPYLDELDPDTAKIGAVNVIKIIRQGKAKAAAGHGRRLESRLPRPGKPGHREHLCLAQQAGQRNIDLCRPDARSDGRAHGHRQLHARRHVSQS